MPTACANPDPKAILVVLPTWVGDFVMATPTLRVIRRRFAKAHIAFLMEPNLADLVRGGDWMDECIVWPARDKRSILHREARALVLDLRRRRFDWAVLLPNSFRSALLSRMAGAMRRIGYDRDGRGWLLTDRIPVKNREPNWWRGDQAGPAVPPTSGSADARTRQRRTVVSDELLAVAELPGPRVWPGANVAVRMGRRLPAELGPYRPVPMVEYYADLAEAIGCERPDDRLELFVTPDCEEAVAARLSGAATADRAVARASRAADVSPRDLPHDENITGASPRPKPAALGPLVVIGAGAKFGASKCWMPEGFAAVADRLIESHGATIIITCGPGEESIARKIAESMRSRVGGAPLRRDSHGCCSREGDIEGTRVIVFDQPFLTLGELKSLIRRCDLLICNDTGPRHFAKAFNVPVLTIFGPTHPDWTATSYADERIVRVDLDCGPCQQKTCPLSHHECMTRITPDIVYAAAVELLQSRTVTAGGSLSDFARASSQSGHART